MTTLKPAVSEDATLLLDIQQRSFRTLLEKYQDYETNPAMEPLERLQWKLADPNRDYWFILEDRQPVGFASVRHLTDTLCVSPIGLIPEYQGKGTGHEAMLLLEGRYPENQCWELETILQEPGLCRFYENLGYRRTGEPAPIKPGMDIISYKKSR